LKADLPEKKAQLEKFRLLARDVVQHQPQLNALLSQAQQLDEPTALKDMDDLVQHYNQLKAEIDGTTFKLQDRVTEHEQYKEAYRQSMDWVLAKRQELQMIGDSSGSETELQEKLRRLKEFDASKPDGLRLFDQASGLASTIEGQSSSAGKDRISQEMKILQEEMDALKLSAGETEYSLEEAVQGLHEFEMEHADFANWLDAVEQQIVAKTDRFQYAAPLEHSNEFEVCRLNI
jgi:hypothetical protein